MPLPIEQVEALIKARMQMQPRSGMPGRHHVLDQAQVTTGIVPTDKDHLDRRIRAPIPHRRSTHTSARRKELRLLGCELRLGEETPRSRRSASLDSCSVMSGLGGAAAGGADAAICS
jgi:hypothetical protein